VYKLSGNESGWHLAGSVDSKSRPGISDGREESALNMFKQMDLKGKVKDDTKLGTVHQNTIGTVRVYEGGPGRLTKFTSKSLSFYFSYTDSHQRVV
jgi:actin related protein 2/3 complex, subunit 1A/1B